MEPVKRKILEQVLAGTLEPVVVVHVDQPDWPVALANSAFAGIGGDAKGKPFADVIEALGGRELALEVSEAVRSGEETSFPMEVGSREYLLVMKPVSLHDKVTHYAAYWRGSSGSASADSAEMHHALLNAKRRIRDLSRDDPVTGLLNATFRLDEFDAYIEVFGRHASDSCLRRVGQAIRRCLRRASDVVARPAGAVFVALSHASEETAVREFAADIATAVRELGLHHPRSKSSKFVTVSFDVVVADAAGEARSAGEFLDALLERVAE